MRLFLLSTLLNVCGFIKIHGEIYLNHPSVPYYQVQPYYQQYYHYSVPINYSPPKIIGASIQFAPPTNKFAHNRHLHWFKKLKKIKKKGVKYLKKYLARCKSPIKFKIIKKHDFKLQPNLRGNNAMPYGFGTEYFPQKETQKSNYSTIYIPVQANSNKTTTNKQITPIYNPNMDIRSKINTVASNRTVNKSAASFSANNWIPSGFAENKKGISS